MLWHKITAVYKHVEGVAMVTTQLQSLDTVLHADTVAWCTGLQDGDFLACGTYQLHEDTGCRKGGVHLYNLYYEMNETGLSVIMCTYTHTNIL